MRTDSEKYANSSKYYMDDTDFVCDCSIVSIVNDRKNIRLSGTAAWYIPSGEKNE